MKPIFWNRTRLEDSSGRIPWCPCRWGSLQKVSILDTGEIIQLERVFTYFGHAKEEYETLIIGIIWKRWKKRHWLDLVVHALRGDDGNPVVSVTRGYFDRGVGVASFSTTCDLWHPPHHPPRHLHEETPARNDHCQHTQLRAFILPLDTISRLLGLVDELSDRSLRNQRRFFFFWIFSQCPSQASTASTFHVRRFFKLMVWIRSGLLGEVIQWISAMLDQGIRPLRL